MAKNDLTVSIVAYEDKEDVLKAVTSLYKVTDPSIRKEVFIIDNSPEPLFDESELKAFDSLTYIVNVENLGFGKAHNRVLSLIDSDFHCIMNPDIILEEDVFSILIPFMKDNKAAIAAPKIMTPEGELQKAYRLDPTRFDMFIRMFVKWGFKKRKDRHTMSGMDYEKPFNVPFIQGSFLLLDTKLFKEAQGFDERFFMYMEDADLCRRLREYAPVLYCPDTYVIHKWEKGSHKSFKLFKAHVSSMRKYFRKWN